MLKTLVIYIGFVFSIYLIGRLFIIFLKKIFKENNSEIFGIKISYFYLLVGLISMSQLLFIFNFFFGLDKLNIFMFLSIVVFLNLIFYSRIKFTYELILNLFILFSLFISFYDIGLSKDSYLYHLSSQSWIFTEKIVFGLSNLNPYLGYMSINEYVLSILSNYGLINSHSLNLLYLLIFFSILVGFLFSKVLFYRNIFFGISFFGFLDNFGFEGGRNGFFAIQEINKFDYSFSIIFVIFVIFYLYLLKVKKELIFMELFVLTFIVLFAIQLRVFGGILFFPLLYIVLKFKSNIFKIIPLGIFGILWILKNYINTSCLLYPIQFTCIASKWYFPQQADYVSIAVLDSFRDPSFGINSIDNFAWIKNVFIPESYSFILNFFLTCILFFLLTYVIGIRTSFALNKKESFFNLLIIILLLVVWILYLPSYRFSSAFLLTVFFILNLNFFLYGNRGNVFSYFKITPLFLVAILLINNLGDYKNFVSDPFSNKEIILPDITYTLQDGYGVKPSSVGIQGQLCYSRKDCYFSNYNLKISSNPYQYKTIIPIQQNYYLKIMNEINS
tara:strand:+ start:1250 stop:2923 length:1674 start_codon:yes stop_codon:yes gene_type:complete